MEGRKKAQVHSMRKDLSKVRHEKCRGGVPKNRLRRGSKLPQSTPSAGKIVIIRVVGDKDKAT